MFLTDLSPRTPSLPFRIFLLRIVSSRASRNTHPKAGAGRRCDLIMIALLQQWRVPTAQPRRFWFACSDHPRGRKYSASFRFQGFRI